MTAACDAACRRGCQRCVDIVRPSHSDVPPFTAAATFAINILLWLPLAIERTKLYSVCGG